MINQRQYYALEQSLVNIKEIDQSLLTVAQTENIFDRRFILHVDRDMYPKNCEGFLMNVTFRHDRTIVKTNLGSFPLEPDGPSQDGTSYICSFYPTWSMEYQDAIAKIADQPGVFNLPDGLYSFLAISFQMIIPGFDQSKPSGVSVSIYYTAHFVS